MHHLVSPSITSVLPSRPPWGELSRVLPLAAAEASWIWSFCARGTSLWLGLWSLKWWSLRCSPLPPQDVRGLLEVVDVVGRCRCLGFGVHPPFDDGCLFSSFPHLQVGFSLVSSRSLVLLQPLGGPGRLCLGGGSTQSGVLHLAPPLALSWPR